MKYDSGMTYLNKDILAAVRMMCRNDSKITEELSPNDGPPAPITLRDYLKAKYGKTNYRVHSGNVHFICNLNNMRILFNNNILNNLGDTVLTLSWSQVTKFIIDNWEAVFCKESTENQPSPAAEEPAEANKPKPTYKDVLLEHYPNFDVSMFDEFTDKNCVEKFFDDGRELECLYYPDSPDEDCKKCWERKCKHKWKITEGKKNIEPYINVPTEESAANDNTDTKTTDLPNPPIPANAEEIASTFNYAVLSTEMGDYLKRKEQQLKNEYMNFTANCGAIFAEVQERLAKDGHGTFIKWIESMGFKSATVYRMIDVNKFRLSLIEKDENGTQEIFDALPKYLQYDISAKSAPPELVEQVLNGDITTHAEYIKLKKELEHTQEECHRIDANSAAKDKEYQRQLDEANGRANTAEMQSRTYRQNYLQMEKNFDEMSNENINLEKRIKELESRPVNVAVQQDEKALAEKEAEIQRLKDELAELSQRQSCSLDDCFDNSGNVSERQLLDFYETLHANAISAIKDCARFIKDKIPNNLQGDAKSRFKMLEELLADCKEEMEE